MTAMRCDNISSNNVQLVFKFFHLFPLFTECKTNNGSVKYLFDVGLMAIITEPLEPSM